MSLLLQSLSKLRRRSAAAAAASFLALAGHRSWASGSRQG